MMDDSPDAIIKWLESPEGEQWSFSHHGPVVNNLVIIKADEFDDESYHPVASLPVWTTYLMHGVRYAESDRGSNRSRQGEIPAALPC